MSKRNLLRAAILMSAIMVAPLPCLHAQKPAPPAPVPTFRSEVDLLSVAARVIDRRV